MSAGDYGTARERSLPGLLPLLRAAAAGTRDFHLATLEPAVIRDALAKGLGPLMAHVTSADGTRDRSPYADAIRAADLTAFLLAAEKREALVDVLAALARVGCRPVLLKGMATALRYYARPHLRTMGDIDLLIEAAQREAAEAQLRAVGFRQRSHEPPSAFVRRHHGMPFFHPERCVWLDLHTSLHPPQYPLASHESFSPERVARHVSELPVDGQTAGAMSDEMQLVYTSARWAEQFSPARGTFPLLDAVLILRTCGSLDWDRVRAIAGDSWAATALHVLLTYVRQWELAPVPPGMLAWLAATDRHSNRGSRALLHHMVTRYGMEGRPFGAALTEHNLGIAWMTLLRPSSPLANVMLVPWHIAFPPRRPHASSRSSAFRRIGSLVTRVLRRPRQSAPAP